MIGSGGSKRGWPPDRSAASGARLGRVVVTGAYGFLGGHVARALALAGESVVGLDRRPAGQAAQLAAVGVETRSADLLRDAVAPLLDGASVVFHLAGRAGVRESWGDRFVSYLGANVLATQRLLEACEKAGVPRLVLASSSSVYGQATWTPTHEDTVPAPLSPYGVTKLAAERLALAYASRDAATTGVVALRYFTVYGPGQRLDMLVGRLLRAAVSGEPAPLYGDGTQSRDFTYVDDAVRATVAAAHVPGRAEVVKVGSGVSTSVRQVVGHICEVSGRQVPLRPAGDQAGDVQCTHADLRRARLLLGYSPRVDLGEGLKRQFDEVCRDVTRRTNAAAAPSPAFSLSVGAAC
jgi:UDP-glucuronate 4-epimerase